MMFNKLSKKERVGLLICAVIVVLALSDRLIINPISVKMGQINQEIKITEKQLGKNLRNLIQKDVVNAEYQKYLTYVKKERSDEEEVAKILDEVEELGRKSSVYLVEVKPKTPQTIDFYKEYIIEVEAEGNPEAIIHFLHQLNSSSQLLRAKKLRLTVKDDDLQILKAGIVITKVIVP